jgi:methionine sulfoxide reductase heme-binding subunit
MSFLDLSSTTGLIATAVLTVNLLLGMLVGASYKRLPLWRKMPRLIRKLKLFDVHNWTAYVALVLSLIHPVLLLFDASTKFTLMDILFPINAPTQGVFVALGTIALLAVIVVVITTQRSVRRKFGFRTWKNIHLAAYLAAILFIVHGVVMDPELKNRPIDFFDGEKLLSEGCFIILVAASVFRYRFYKKKQALRRFEFTKAKRDSGRDK